MGRPWNNKERALLTHAFHKGADLKALAQQTERTSMAVVNQLSKLSLLYNRPDGWLTNDNKVWVTHGDLHLQASSERNFHARHHKAR